FPEINGPGQEKRVLSRHRICIPAVLTYGIAASSEQTEVTNLNERGLFVYCSTLLAHGTMIKVEMVLPAELNSYGRRRVRYHASVVRVEPSPVASASASLPPLKTASSCLWRITR